jgi:AP endonuclease-2
MICSLAGIRRLTLGKLPWPSELIQLTRRPSNYGSRIDYILCSPGLRPWIKGGDIQNKVFGSDHCPVYIDLHDSITTQTGEVLHIKDQLNPPNRPPSTAPLYPTDPPRTAPEPPRFATKFLDEFSGKQQTLKSFFGGGRKKSESVVSPSPTPTASEATASEAGPSGSTKQPVMPKEASVDERAPKETIASADSMTTPFGLARAAFESIDTSPSASANAQASSSRPRSRSKSTTIDLTADEPIPTQSTDRTTPITKPTKGKAQPKKTTKSLTPSQTKLSTFFQPPAKAKRQSPPSPEITLQPRKRSSPLPEVDSLVDTDIPELGPDPVEEALIAQAVAEADQERSEQRAVQKAKAAPVWNELFARKLPPLCTVHQKPCKDFSESPIPFAHDSRADMKLSRYLVQIKARGSGYVHCMSLSKELG